MQFPSKSQQDYFVATEKIILKLMWKGTETRIAKKKFFLKKKNKVGEISPTYVKTYYVPPVIIIMWYILGHRH